MLQPGTAQLRDALRRQMISCGPEAVLIGRPGDGVGDAVVTDERVRPAHDCAEFLPDLSLLAADVHRLAVRQVVAVGERPVRVLDVGRAEDLDGGIGGRVVHSLSSGPAGRRGQQNGEQQLGTDTDARSADGRMLHSRNN